MESACDLLIALDAGHGGWDGGAIFLNRREKDDNLRLALKVGGKLQDLGLQTLMIRSGDYYVPPEKRAEFANKNDADLFVSFHRACSAKPNEDAGGVECYVYLTAPLEETGRAAQLILSELDAAGVQRIIGVSRGNYGVLRRVSPPAVLLNMGFINNETDNNLFDRKLDSYAEAIAKGISGYFGLLSG